MHNVRIEVTITRIRKEKIIIPNGGGRVNGAYTPGRGQAGRVKEATGGSKDQR